MLSAALPWAGRLTHCAAPSRGSRPSMLSLVAHAPVSFMPAMVPARAPRSAPMMQAAEAAPEPEPEPYNPVTFAKSLAGIAGPLGYFDPLGFSTGDASEGKSM